MPPLKLPHPSPHSELVRGSALVVSLVFVILITILILGFATTASLERKSVQSHYGKVQSDLYAAMGVDVAASRIQQATGSGTWWVSQPGRIVRGVTNSTEFVPLVSGTAALPLVEDLSVDLNPAALIAGGGLVSGDAGLRMPVKWVYVREDGTQIIDPPSVPAYDAAASPLAGRYAFWVDDESARVNLNVVTHRASGTAAPASHPSHLDLTALGPLTAADITALRTQRLNRVYESPQEARGATNSPTLAAALGSHKMDVIHYSHGPDLNLFGEPKIVLTTKASRAGGRPFFDILTNPNADPGINTNVDPDKYNALFATLYTYLSRTDWPLDPGKSFVQKYGPQNTAQLILNLIDYVRSAEAEKVIVEASRGSFNGTTFSWGSGVSGPTGFMGNARRFLITQMGVWVSPTAPFTCRFRTEVYLPESVGDPTTVVDLWEGNRRMFCEIRGSEIGPLGSSAPVTPADQQNIQGYGSIEGGAGPASARAKMRPGDYRTISMPFALALNDPAKRPEGPFYLRATIRIAGNNNVGADIAPLLQETGTGQAVYAVDPPETTFAAIGSISVNDPVINKSRLDWAQTSANTFGRSRPTLTSVSTLGQAADNSTPQKDTTAGGLLTDEGFGFPAVKGSSKNPRGMVESIGELGRVHTGGKGTALAGVPWRTLRLQPRKASDTSLPDWALLNLFTVPAEARGVDPTDLRNAAVLQPGDGVGGRVNVNSQIYPFSSLIPPVTRTAPMRAVLQNTLAGLPEAEAETTATNIANGTLATGGNPGRAYGPEALQNAGLFLMPEQVVEIQGVADGGEASETRVRALLPFVSAQSSVYAVYAVGQKITQLRDGRIRVLAESRRVSLVERLNGSVNILSTKELW